MGILLYICNYLSSDMAINDKYVNNVVHLVPVGWSKQLKSRQEEQMTKIEEVVKRKIIK